MQPRLRPLSRLPVAVVAVVTALVVLVGGSASAGAAPDADQAAAASALRWHACADDAQFQCGSLSVPLDYDVPGGEHIAIAVVRHRATDPARRVGSLFWNPGGPGGGGTTSLPLFYSSFPAQLRARFDIVSFDPRGIGASTPLRCFDSVAQEDALLSRLPVGFPVGAAQEQRQVDVYAEFDAACAAAAGPCSTT